MNEFEHIWRNRVRREIEKEDHQKLNDAFGKNMETEPIAYTKTLIRDLRDNLLEDKIEQLFCNTACHFPHQKLDAIKDVYEMTKSIDRAHKELEAMFKTDIKQYKQLTIDQVQDIIDRGWGLAGVMVNGDIIATKIPSQFHEYFAESDPIKQAYYYCHCPRVKKELLHAKDLDSIYCNCGGGFYQDVWQYITSKDVKIDVLKSLFKGDEVCSFRIRIPA